MKRKDFKRRTVTTFKKVYGDRIYTFSHEKTEIPGYTSAFITVRRKQKGDPANRVGRLVHMLHFEKETD